MKAFILSVAVLLTSAAFAEELSPLEFPYRKLELPALSFLEEAKQKMPMIFYSSVGFYHRPARRVDSPQKLVSKMPMVSPSAVVDTRMPIKSPDEAIDYKLATKEPVVDSVK